MSRLVLQIEREFSGLKKVPILSYFVGDSLKRAVSDPCKVSLEVDGQIIRGPVQTTLSKGVSPKDLLSFLKSYRNAPGKTPPEQNIREGLHNFLFAQRVFDGPVGAALARNVDAQEGSEILIRGNSSSLPLIINIPWELADAVQTAAAPRLEPILLNTLAAFPLARVVSHTKAHLTSVKERLRVLYCISQPPTLDQIHASEFQEALKDAFAARLVSLTYDAVIDGDFTPNFNQLKAGISRTQPHILVIVSHGQTIKGIPHLHFEKWQPVSTLADALAQSGKAFLVVVIACDQTHLDEHPSAHSGAVTLLQRGILSVVAMQSSVSASLAKEFLGTTLDWFLETGAIALSVAEGRKSMAPSVSSAEKIVDWSFPALFLTEDAPQHADKLTRIIAAYLPTLDEMLRRIPRPEPYLERPKFDDRLTDFLKVEVAGLRQVTGAAYTGKTSIVLNACRRSIQRAVDRNDTATRPVLYVDFGRYSETPNTARELMEILRKQTDEIHSVAAGTPLLTWTSPRGADGEAGMLDPTGQLVAFIDLNRMVLVLDNLEETDDSFWSDFFERVRNLNRSLVIRVREANVAGGLEILPFTQEETEEYVRSFASDHVATTADWFAETGGLPGLLDLLRKSDGDHEVVTMSAFLFTRNLPAADQNILYTLASLPNGVDPQLANLFAEADMHDLVRLSQKGLLLRESRFGVTSSWFRLPRLLTRALRDDTEGTTNAAISLADRFADRITSDDDASPTEVLGKLAGKPGGIDFLQDIHQVFINLEYQDQAHALPLLLHKSLFATGRWYEAFRFWERVLNHTPFEETEAHEWLKLAKAAHVLGFGSKAHGCIAKAKERQPTSLDEIDSLILEAVIIKDSGNTDRATEVTELYAKILALIDEAKVNLAALEADEITESDLAERHALTTYNRALHRRYWLRDLAGALSDLDQAGAAFGKLGETRMKALADCEWVDVQLDSTELNKDWEKMLERLINANEVFVSVGGAAGDSAFCNYQLARYFRRKPFSTQDEFKVNNIRVRDAYRAAIAQAQLAGDSRQKEIAEGHLIEVRWLELDEIGAGEASDALEKVVSVLLTYEGDAWSSRVLRDMLRIRAQALTQLNAENSLEAYEAAWEAAARPPLHPSYGVDARRTARILTEYLEELQKNNQVIEADRISVLAKPYIQQWLDRDIDPSQRESWLEEVRQYGAERGDNYGQPKR